MASIHTQGQRHDRIVTPAGNGALDMPSEPNFIGKPVEVSTSVTQKMLSATTGSLMTSLLGMSVWYILHAALCFFAVHLIHAILKTTPTNTLPLQSHLST